MLGRRWVAVIVIFVCILPVILWPTSWSVRGVGILTSSQRFLFRAPAACSVVRVSASSSGTVKSGQELYELSGIGFGNQVVVAPFSGTFQPISGKLEQVSMLIEGQEIASVYDPSKMSVLALFPMRYLQELRRGTSVFAFPKGNLYQDTGEVNLKIDSGPLVGQDL